MESGGDARIRVVLETAPGRFFSPTLAREVAYLVFRLPLGVRSATCRAFRAREPRVPGPGDCGTSGQ